MEMRARSLMLRWSPLVALTGLILAAACSGGGVNSPAGTVSVSGVVRDWRTGAPVAAASLKTVGILPQLTADSDASGKFRFDTVPINGYLILDVSAVGSVDTLSPTILVQQQNVTNLVVLLVSQADAAATLTGFSVTQSNGHGTVLGHAVNLNTGAGLGGVAAIQLLPLSFDQDGPHFLDLSDGVPTPPITATTSGGGFVYFNVSTGNIAVQASQTGFVFQPVASVIQNGAWSIVDLQGDGGGPGGTPTPTPTGTPGPQSFATNIYPIFKARGCSGANSCHLQANSGALPASGLTLGGPASGGHKVTMADVYNNITNTTGVINLADPPASQILTRPLFLDTTGLPHPADIYQNTSDPDYQKVLRWIVDGAQNN